MVVITSAIETLADLLDRLGGVPLNRVRFRSLGVATVQDVIDLQQQKGKLCELVDGVLLEKAAGYNESTLAVLLAGLLNAFVIPRNLGLPVAARRDAAGQEQRGPGPRIFGQRLDVCTPSAPSTGNNRRGPLGPATVRVGLPLTWGLSARGRSSSSVP
jgi:hypothetical protein